VRGVWRRITIADHRDDHLFHGAAFDWRDLVILGIVRGCRKANVCDTRRLILLGCSGGARPDAQEHAESKQAKE
jgi:hypothetical protein